LTVSLNKNILFLSYFLHNLLRFQFTVPYIFVVSSVISRG